MLIFAYCVISATAVYSCFRVNILSGCICAAAFLSVGGVFFLFTRNQYKKIADLSDSTRKMADGEFVYDIRDNSEGELSILKNDIYKLASRLTEQADLLQREKAMLKDMLFDISHQLKTPLTSLTVMADLLEQEQLPEEKRREFINNLQKGLSRMDWLVKSLLKIAKLDAGTVPLKSENVYVDELLSNALLPVMTLLDIKNQKLSIEIDKSLLLACDMNWTVEALANILKNAAEHTPDGGIITVTSGENPIYLWISVKDSGGGIDATDLPHLFKRFYKGKQSGKDNVGIGLAMSLSIMQKQNGDIEIQTEKDTGSAFTLKFYKSAV